MIWEEWVRQSRDDARRKGENGKGREGMKMAISGNKV